MDAHLTVQEAFAGAVHGGTRDLLEHLPGLPAGQHTHPTPAALARHDPAESTRHELLAQPHPHYCGAGNRDLGLGSMHLVTGGGEAHLTGKPALGAGGEHQGASPRGPGRIGPDTGESDAELVDGDAADAGAVAIVGAGLLGAAGQFQVDLAAVDGVGAVAVEFDPKRDTAGGGDFGGIHLALDGGSGEVESGVGVGADDAGAVDGLTGPRVFLNHERLEARGGQATSALGASRAGADHDGIDIGPRWCHSLRSLFLRCIMQHDTYWRGNASSGGRGSSCRPSDAREAMAAATARGMRCSTTRS